MTVDVAGVRVLTYAHRPDPEPAEAPKPYLHPLRTLAGDVVTGYRPADHRWHKGLQLTASHLSGENFWGGGSYVHQQRRYVPLRNHGTVRHDTLTATGGGSGAVLRGRLTWCSSRGEPWVREHREITVTAVEPEHGSWELRWTSALTGLRDEPLRFGSPATHGRAGAGYSGLFWRGPGSFTGGRVIGPGGAEGEAELLGRRARWLAFTGRHEATGRDSTLLFQVAGPGPGGAEEPEAAAHWFVRSEEYPGVNPSWAFHREFELARGRTLTRRYRTVVATGAWTASRVEEYLTGHSC
ncbi:oxidoreductase [Wenjunlia vitaminophila]|uniref:Oxidoreductase n=1 Tax=Wenjunlia vitaminophila TaxID=76728 RepID=A0A0T6LPW8_WENVI|nr:oxidoreductase [Wenjunlia vitaminophila]